MPTNRRSRRLSAAALIRVVALAGLFLTAALGACARPKETATPPPPLTATTVPSATPTAVPTETAAPTATVEATATAAPAPTAAPTALPTVTATAAPTETPAPAVGWIALEAWLNGNWDIYAVDAVSGARTRLTADPAEDCDPAFSPAGDALAFASRRGGQWDVYMRAPDGALARLTETRAYDGAPAWSPDGTHLAYESMADGNLDVWLLDLASGERTNLTAESPHAEGNPAFSPDGTQIAFTSWRHGDADLFALDLTSGEVRQLTSAPVEEALIAWEADGRLLYTVLDGEAQDVYARTADDDPALPGTRLTRWSVVGAAARSSDGTSLAYLLRYARGTRLLVQRTAGAFALPVWLTEPLTLSGPLSWTASAEGWTPSTGDSVVLYVEETHPGDGSPFDLVLLDGVDVGSPWLSDRVDDAFRAMRERAIEESGHDFFSQLSDAWRAASFYSSGSSYTSWHKAGRAIDTLVDYLSPDRRARWLEVVLEPRGGDIYWRLYLRCVAQDGGQGAPLKTRPWDVTADARRNGLGGRRKALPDGYYVDLTDLMAQYGWLPIASHDHPDFHWHTNFVALEYWHFQKTGGLPWYEAMLEVIPPEVMAQHHSWDAQQMRGTPAWLAWAKGVPMPWSETRTLARIER